MCGDVLHSNIIVTQQKLKGDVDLLNGLLRDLDVVQREVTGQLAQVEGNVRYAQEYVQQCWRQRKGSVVLVLLLYCELNVIGRVTTGAPFSISARSTDTHTHTHTHTHVFPVSLFPLFGVPPFLL